MSAILHCDVKCSGAVKASFSSVKVCDIDGIKLTPEYRAIIKEYGCSFYTMKPTPRRNSIICSKCFKPFPKDQENNKMCIECQIKTIEQEIENIEITIKKTKQEIKTIKKDGE
jgi:hypothetical protein